MTYRLAAFLRRNVIALLALSIALGGTAYALSKDSVGARELGEAKLRSTTKKIDAGEERSVEKRCRRGEQLLSGGYAAFAGDPPVPLDVGLAQPITVGAGRNPKAFMVIAENNAGAPGFVTAFAACLRI